MSADLLREVLMQADKLNVDEKLRLVTRLLEQLMAATGVDVLAEERPYGDAHFGREYAWIRAHRNEYAGQYVALDGEQLLAAGESGRAVLAEARKLGVPVPFITRIEAPDELPFGGW